MVSTLRASWRNKDCAICRKFPMIKHFCVLMTNVARFCDMPIITLHVGEARRKFHVHKGLICRASPAFKASFANEHSGGWIESADASKQAMNLPEDDEKAVERFVQWLYTKNYKLPGYVSGLEANARFYQLAELYVFADKYLIGALKNDVIDKFFEMGQVCKHSPSLGLVSYVYGHTTKQASFRKLLIAWYTNHMTLSWYSMPETRGWLEKNAEFAADIAVALARRLDVHPMNNPFLLCNPEDYYEDFKESHTDLGAKVEGPRSSLTS